MQVVRDNEPLQVEMNLGKSARISEFSWKITTEEGEVLEVLTISNRFRRA